jgi:nitrate reductase NapAB chaperone NapD
MNNEEIKLELNELEKIDINLNDEENLNINMNTEVIEKILDDYNNLKNKPKINDVELVDNKTFEELGIENIKNSEILNLFN